MIDESNEGATLGLRERNKQRTRERIAGVAMALFLERGFERVTIADVAKAADVAQQTVFNYFGTKEGLVYWRLSGVEDDLLSSLRSRAEGESLASAFQRFIFERQGLLGEDDPASFERLVAINRIIANSPALRARERAVFDRCTDAFAALIAEERGLPKDDVGAWTLANALVGVHRALVEYVRRQLALGRRGKSLRSSVTIEANRAFSLIRGGIDTYDRSSEPSGASRESSLRDSASKQNGDGGEAGIRTLDTGEPV